MRVIPGIRVQEVLEGARDRQVITMIPASAAGVAGLLNLAERNFFKPQDTVVCIIIGHGLKDPDSAIAAAPTPCSLPAEKGAVVDYRPICEWF
jgi:threonine synthase